MGSPNKSEVCTYCSAPATAENDGELVCQAHGGAVQETSVGPLILQKTGRVHFEPCYDSEYECKLHKAAPELVEALRGLFEHCSMIHKHWGPEGNHKEADAAIEKARTLLTRLDGEK